MSNFNPYFLKNVAMFAIAGYLYGGQRWCLIGMLVYMLYATVIPPLWESIKEWNVSRKRGY